MNPLQGALLDTRPKELKDKDYTFKEIVASANPVNWTEKTVYRHFPIFNQDSSGSCVAQTMAKMLGIMYWLKNQEYVHFSATHIYQRRVNKPAGGMAGDDVFQIAQKGVTLEDLVASQNMSDYQMDNVIIPQYKQDVGSVFKIGNYIILPVKDMETVASVIQTTGKGLMTWFGFQIDEWTDVPVIKNTSLDINTLSTCRHSLTAVDFTLFQGKKALVIEDSWGTSYGKAGQRIITEDFFKTRNFYSAYAMNFAFDNANIIKPIYTFAKILKFSSTYFVDADVKALQDILKYEGLIATNIQSTGYYGSITADSVLKFQKKYNVASLEELDSLQGRQVGKKTITKLNELYS